MPRSKYRRHSHLNKHKAHEGGVASAFEHGVSTNIKRTLERKFPGFSKAYEVFNGKEVDLGSMAYDIGRGRKYVRKDLLAFLAGSAARILFKGLKSHTSEGTQRPSANAGMGSTHQPHSQNPFDMQAMVPSWLAKRFNGLL